MSSHDITAQRLAEIEQALRQLDDQRRQLEQEKATLLSQHAVTETPQSNFTTQEKLALFMRLFHGRTDVYAQRWESRAGTSGYSFACANEWRPGMCRKPTVKCADCKYREYKPMNSDALHNHLTGRETLGVYPFFAR